jgi:hypothetical protein
MSDAKMIGLYKSYIEVEVAALMGPFGGSLIHQFQVLMNYVGISVPSASKKDKMGPDQRFVLTKTLFRFLSHRDNILKARGRQNDQL